MLPSAATDFYALQQRVSKVAQNETRRAWRRMGDDFDSSWRLVSANMLSALVEAQTQMVGAADAYVPKVLAQTDIADEPEGHLVPKSLVGVASDQRPLESLAYGAVATTKQAVAEGASTTVALQQGGDWLDLMTRLQVADSARQAVSVLIGGRKNIAGYIRVLNPPSCQRCAILAGRFYRWSAGFQRHPRCDCVNLPSKQAHWAKAEGFLTDPMDAFRAGDIRDLTRAQRAAIENGADISQVVNARRGMSDLGLTTSEGTTRRGVAGKRLGNFARQPGARYSVSQTPRLTPEAIYQVAGSRNEAIDLLRRNGYLI